jgi:L-ascorbate metabolism protein UlaG (beta-lactamase superfamily)
MIRFCIALAAGLLLAAASPADESKKVTIRWHGQSFFEIISSQGTRIVTDPHAIDVYGRISVKADLILVSHFHNDHTQVDVVENKDKAKIIYGLKPNGRKTDWNLVDERFRDVNIRTVGVYHDAEEGLERGKNAVFIIEVDGLHIVHLGDLGHPLTDAQVKKIGPVDVLLIPVGGVYTINGLEAKKVVELLKPRQYVIPMHYGTKVFDELLPVDEFLEDQDKTNIKIYEHTNKLVVESDFRPREPIIAVLNWK